MNPTGPPWRVGLSVLIFAVTLLFGWPTLSIAVNVIAQFEGLAASDDISLTASLSVPPDNGLAAGPKHIFEMVNTVGRITDKHGVLTFQFTLGGVNGGGGGFFGVDPGFSQSDPRVIYDSISGRWFATYFQYSSSGGSSSIILAVTSTSDPTGARCLYRLGNPASETFVQDYPMLGVSDDKVVVSYNAFNFTTNAFLGGGYYVLNKANLVACASVNFTRVPPNSALFTTHPAQSLGSTSTLYMTASQSNLGGNSLTLLAINGVPGVTTVTQTSTPVPIRSWMPPPGAQQAGSTVLLDTGDARVVSTAWQNNSLWLAGNEACTPTGDTFARSCLRVIEIQTDSPGTRQDFTYAASGQYYLYPAVRPDSSGNLHVVFTRSSASDFAGVRVTSRRVADPLNTLPASTGIRAGGGAQTGSSRMGDYSGAAVDPVDPRKVWVSGEYIRSMAPADWGTYVAEVSFVVPAAKDFDGDGKADVAVYRKTAGAWFIQRSSDGGLTQLSWGCPGCRDVPMPGDYDGDGKADIAVYRTSTGEWFIRRSSDGGLTHLNWGWPGGGDVPVAGDYDGDGTADIAVYRTSTGQWFVQRSSDGGLTQLSWGCPSCGDVPMRGDYDGDGTADIAVYRNSTGQWFVRRSSDGGLTQVSWGCPACGDLPVPDDYDSDGKADIAVYRNSTGQWFVLRSSDGGLTQVSWGAPALMDIPAEVTTSEVLTIPSLGTNFGF